jgi:hypothetical protein
MRTTRHPQHRIYNGRQNAPWRRARRDHSLHPCKLPCSPQRISASLYVWAVNVTYHRYHCNETKQIVSSSMLIVYYNLLPNEGVSFIIGLQGRFKFFLISPGSRGLRRTERNVGAFLSRRTGDAAASPLCAGTHPRHRPGGRSRTRHTGARINQDSFVAARDRYPCLALHHNAPSICQHGAARGAGKGNGRHRARIPRSWLRRIRRRDGS